jgi:transposase
MEPALCSSSFDSLSPPPSDGLPALIPVLKLVSITQRDLTQLKLAANYWKALHQRSCAREAILKKTIEQNEAHASERETHLKNEIELKEAQIRDLRHRLFAKKSESIDKTIKQQPSQAIKRPRGQQRGSRGHGRTQRPDLPVIEEHRELQDAHCIHCGLQYSAFPGAEDSEIVEIEVKAYRRKVFRKRYMKSCSCPSAKDSPQIIVAPPAPKIIPKSPYGISIWVHILLAKFLYSQPLHRALRELSGLGLSMAPGSMTGGLQKIAALFIPLQAALYEHQMSESRFHSDESRWEVYAELDGKVGHRWYLWVTKSAEVVHYQIASTRSAAVPLAHYSGLAQDKVIVVCDRFSSYKKLARLNAAITLAYCWAHVRRDFLDLALKFPALEKWALAWVDEIATSYHLNHQRLAHWNGNLPLTQQSVLFDHAQKLLTDQTQLMNDRSQQLLLADQSATNSSGTAVKQSSARKGADEINASTLEPGQLHEAQRNVLISLQNHWQGLIIFLTHPEVSMDNNSAERAIRNPVIGRKNYYGSGSIWSAELAAMMFSQLQTIELWQLNPRHWLQEYLTACAELGGTAPTDLTPFLPWSMSEDRRRQLAKPPPGSQNTS